MDELDRIDTEWMQSGAHGRRLFFTDIVRRVQTAPLPVPLRNPSVLPLVDLEPEVLERLATEVVSRLPQAVTTHFYGRRGQKQHGLDIVQWNRSDRPTLYQVKRFPSISAAQLRRAVVEFAGAPRPLDFSGSARLFNPGRFVVVTSAAVESDTEVSNALGELRTDYSGDLEIEAWGVEALSRMLRDLPRVVYAVFGPAWAEAFCGFVPGPQELVAPRARGFVEDPARVLGLHLFHAEAENAEACGDPATAAQRFGVLATSLAESGFPGEAALAWERQAKAHEVAGNVSAAFEVLYDMAIGQVHRGWGWEIAPLLAEMGRLAASLGDEYVALHQVLDQIAWWHRRGTRLSIAVPALRRLADAQNPNSGTLTCLVLEQALVDGMFDALPAQLPPPGDSEALRLRDELHALAREASCADAVMRARLRCGLADASLAADSGPEAVEAAYRRLISEASAGRFLESEGLVAARAARAFAVGGDLEQAELLWRQSVIASCEHGYYGDARGAIRSVRSLVAYPSGQAFGPVDLTQMPNRRRLLAGAFNPELAALEQAHDNRLPTAFADARRFLWESRLSGQLVEESRALSLFGDVLAASGQPAEALSFHIHGSAAAKAVAQAQLMSTPVDVTRWLASHLRGQRAAAAQVLKSQSALLPDELVEGTIELLLRSTDGLWQLPPIGPYPEIDAVAAIADFGSRIPASTVDRILELAEPGLHNPGHGTEATAHLLVQTYWAVADRRRDIAKVLVKHLCRPDASYELWLLIAGLAPQTREPLLEPVTQLSLAGHDAATETLATWGIATPEVQRRARQSCAELLRRPVGLEGHGYSFGNQEEMAVVYLKALLSADDLDAVTADELRPDACRPAGGVLAVFAQIVDDSALPPTVGEPATVLSSDQPDQLDQAARLAAAPPAELLTAVAAHLTAMATDTGAAAAFRVQCLIALRTLIGVLPPERASELLPRVHAMHREPEYSENDLSEMASNHPLSSYKVDTGARHLPALALLTSADLFALGCSAELALSAAQRELASAIVASASAYLYHHDPEIQVAGAAAVAAVASAHQELAAHTSGLLYHPNEQVRSRGITAAHLSPAVIEGALADPSAHVRSALANRGSELPQTAATALARDPHPAVRHRLHRNTTRAAHDRTRSETASVSQSTPPEGKDLTR